jgi:hypothetical protein
MEAYKMPISMRALGITSLILGLLGGALYWWTPLGMVVSLTGLVLGFVGWTIARRRTTGFGLVIAGMLLSLATLILDWVIAGYGLELIKFQGFR